MKTIYKYILFTAIALIAVMVNFSCEKSNDEAPYILYVRVPNPVQKDSLLVAATQGQLIAIMGGNLQNTREVWFNDQKAIMNQGWITNKSVMVNVPTAVPDEVSNQLRLVFADGSSLSHDFRVAISKPVVNNMFCEYVLEGDNAIINGSYFYPPISVTFPGGITVSSEGGAVSVNEENTILTVKVPQGATEPGQLTVTSNFGFTESNFWFLDNRNIFQGFEFEENTSDPDKPFGELGTNDGVIVDNPGEGDPPLINGNYMRMIFNESTWWRQLFCNWNLGLVNIPNDAILNPKNYNYKFEVCTTKPYDGSGLKIWMNDMVIQNSETFFEWKPPFDSKGQWCTMVIPLDDIAASLGSFWPGVQLDGYFCGVVYAGSSRLDCDMSFDNFRVVPKSLR